MSSLALHINKALSQSIRTHNSELCDVLDIHKESLCSLTRSLFGKRVIDTTNKHAIMNNKEYNGADVLLDCVRCYLDGDEDDLQRYENVMKCFENVESLRDVMTKILNEIDDDVKHQKKGRLSSKFSNKSGKPLPSKSGLRKRKSEDDLGKPLTSKISLRKRRSKDELGDTTDNTALKKPCVHIGSERKQDPFDRLDIDNEECLNQSRKRPLNFAGYKSDDDIHVAEHLKEERLGLKLTNKSGKPLPSKSDLRKRKSKDDLGDITDNTVLKKPRVDNDDERKQDDYDHLDPDSIASLVSTINDVFTNNISTLNALLQGSIDGFALKMVQEQLIAPALSHNPTYITVMNSFLAKLAYKKKRKIEQHCRKFLKVLHNIGEQDASESMKEQLVDAVKERLNIDMNLDNYIL